MSELKPEIINYKTLGKGFVVGLWLLFLFHAFFCLSEVFRWLYLNSTYLQWTEEKVLVATLLFITGVFVSLLAWFIWVIKVST